MRKQVLFWLLAWTFLAVSVSAQEESEIERVFMCSDTTTYTAKYTFVCPDGHDIEWVTLHIKGPLTNDGNVAYQVTSLYPYGYRSYGDLEEGFAFWDMKYLSWLDDFAVSYTLETTVDVNELPVTQTTEGYAVYACELLDGFTVRYPLEWVRSDCVWLPFIMR